MSKQSPMIKN